MSKLNFDKIKTVLGRIHKEFDGKVVQIGFPSGINYDDGESVAANAAMHEFGAPALRIPARPFIRPTVAEKKDGWSKIINEHIPSVILGKETGNSVLRLAGIAAVIDIQAKIMSITSPPLSKMTVDRKGFDKPLIETGLMFDSVSSGVNKIGSEFASGGV